MVKLMLPIPDMTSVEHLKENLHATAIRPTLEKVAVLTQLELEEDERSLRRKRRVGSEHDTIRMSSSEKRLLSFSTSSNCFSKSGREPHLIATLTA